MHNNTKVFSDLRIGEKFFQVRDTKEELFMVIPLLEWPSDQSWGSYKECPLRINAISLDTGAPSIVPSKTEVITLEEYWEKKGKTGWASISKEARN